MINLNLNNWEINRKIANILIIGISFCCIKYDVENATIMHPDLMPIIGREAILSLYDFLWPRDKKETINIIGQ